MKVFHARAMLAQMGGAKFYVFARGMEVLAEKNAEGADVRLGHEVEELRLDGERVRVTARGNDGTVVSEEFDDIVVAVPAPIAAKLASALPQRAVSEETRTYLESAAARRASRSELRHWRLNSDRSQRQRAKPMAGCPSGKKSSSVQSVIGNMSSLKYR